MTHDFQREQWSEGDLAWFEYHCFESDASHDARLWHHSHQQVVVLNEAESDVRCCAWAGSTLAERQDAAMPRLYVVRFADGFEKAVFEDELMTDRRGFLRPAPPEVAIG